MKLRVFTPTEVVIETDAQHVTAEDPTGSLGIRPGHAPLVTPLAKGILTVRTEEGERYAAVNGGVMIVTGDRVDVVSRQAIAGDDLAHLEENVLGSFFEASEQEKKNLVAFEKMRLDFMKRMMEFQRAGQPT